MERGSHQFTPQSHDRMPLQNFQMCSTRSKFSTIFVFVGKKKDSGPSGPAQKKKDSNKKTKENVEIELKQQRIALVYLDQGQ